MSVSEDKDVRQALNDFKRAYEYKKLWIEQAMEDLEFALGEQWDPEDVETLKKVGVRALTINKIKPDIQLLVGIESQNRSDYVAFPEGAEDSVIADISTKILKNINKNTNADYRITEMFRNTLQVGESYLEPYKDYTYDMLYGELKLKVTDATDVYPAPGTSEYDLSDARYICKYTPGLSKDDLLELFPDKEKEIDKIGKGSKLDIVTWGALKVEHTLREDYNNAKNNETMISSQDEEYEEPTYDLLEYYYKKPVEKWYVVDAKLGQMKECKDEQEADAYLEIVKQDTPDNTTAVKIKRTVPEIWLRSIIGNGWVLTDERCWTYPRWRSFPFIPMYGYRTTLRVKKPELKVQGIVRSLKDLNRDLNKRRTQELRLLNSSANSGWLAEEGSFVDKESVKKLGGTPGAIIEYTKTCRNMPQRLDPVMLSQGHAQLSLERTQEMKEVSGINSDLLAMNEGQASGKAIHLRQKQGLVMVQELFDNLSQTKRILGRFLLTQMGDLYDVDTVVRILGEAFIKENFSRPVKGPDGMPVLDQTGQLAMEVDSGLLAQTINKVMNDTLLGKFDVAIGEGAMSETVQYANYMQLLEMQQAGVPIPPEVLIQESSLSNASKLKIENAIQRMQEAAANAPPKGK